MATKDLVTKYGKNKNSHQAINAAIRAELAGGNEALYALTVADDLMATFKSDRPPTIIDRLIEANLSAVQAIAAAMRAEIRRRYDMPTEQ